MPINIDQRMFEQMYYFHHILPYQLHNDLYVYVDQNSSKNMQEVKLDVTCIIHINKTIY